MTDEHDDLTRLLHGAVDDIEPRSGLQAIRSRTTTKESPMTASRPWLLGALGGAVATAAVIGGVVLATDGDDRSGREPDVAGTPSASASQTPTQSPSPSESAGEPAPSTTGSPDSPEKPRAADPASTTVLPVYYVGEVPGGLALYREFQADATTGDDKVLRATERAVELTPVDPDYHSAWPNGADVTSAEATADLITVDISGDLRNRPAGISEREAALAVEQVVYTAQAAFSQGRVPVQILLNGSRSDMVLGVPTSEPLANGPVLETLAHASLTTPFQGQVVSGDTIVVEGVANSFEANVLIELRPAAGGAAVLQDFTTAEGYMGQKLFPFRKTLDVSGVPAGSYVLAVSTDDPSGGAEGNGPHVDTKAVEIR